jgi:hypothetical protein
MSQFFYTRKEPRMPQSGDTGLVYNSFIDSFNMDCVVRSYEYERNKVLVMLNDGHEESREVENTAPPKKGTAPERRRVWVVSEIYLEGNDVTRFRAAAGGIEDLLTPKQVDQPEFLPVDIPTVPAQ